MHPPRHEGDLVGGVSRPACFQYYSGMHTFQSKFIGIVVRQVHIFIGVPGRFHGMVLVLLLIWYQLVVPSGLSAKREFDNIHQCQW